MPTIGARENAKQLTAVADDRSAGDDSWLLIAEGGWMVGQKFSLGNHTILGRDSSCDITIPGTHLSRQHAELAISGNRLQIRDLDSANGTYVNDKLVTESELKPGDTVRFDVLVFRIHGPGSLETTAKTPNRRVKQSEPITSAEKPSPIANKPIAKNKLRPAGNLPVNRQTSTVQKATQSIGTLLAVIIGAIILAAIAYLLTQL
ncbi:MAG: FHA domain-containing protein [Oceanicoccus sp.]